MILLTTKHFVPHPLALKKTRSHWNHQGLFPSRNTKFEGKASSFLFSWALSSCKWSQSLVVNLILHCYVNIRSYCRSIFRVVEKWPPFLFGDLFIKLICAQTILHIKTFRGTDFSLIGLIQIWWEKKWKLFWKIFKMVENPIWWKLTAWYLLKSALPKESKGSGIIFTMLCCRVIIYPNLPCWWY